MVSRLVKRPWRYKLSTSSISNALVITVILRQCSVAPADNGLSENACRTACCIYINAIGAPMYTYINANFPPSNEIPRKLSSEKITLITCVQHHVEIVPSFPVTANIIYLLYIRELKRKLCLGFLISFNSPSAKVLYI